MNILSSFLLAILLLAASAPIQSRTDSDGAFSDQLKTSKAKPGNQNNKGGGNEGGMGGFFGPGGGYGIPGFGKGWSGGYGSGYGGPSGGYAKGGTIRPTVVCKEKGPCFQKKLTCPAKCFTSYSRSGKNYGSGGGGGGCTMDCKKKCVAYC